MVAPAAVSCVVVATPVSLAAERWGTFRILVFEA